MLIALLTVGLVVITSPLATRHRLLALLAFALVAFPKAGIKPGAIPFPLLLGASAIAVVLVLLKTGRMLARGFTMCVAAFVLYVGVSLFSEGQRGATVLAYTIYWSASLALLALLLRTARPGQLPARNLAVLQRAVGIGLVVVLALAASQLFFGLESLKVEGLTIAYGDSYDAKPLFFEGGMKIPSTYQNGNLLGVVSACAFWFLRLGKPTRAMNLITVGCLALLVVSGSRTALLAFALTAAIRMGVKARVAAILTSSVGLVVGYVLVRKAAPGLADRYRFESLFHSGGSGRTLQWSYWWDQLDLASLVFGDPNWHPQTAGAPVTAHSLAEGLPGLIQQVGLIGLALVFVILCGALRLALRLGYIYVAAPMLIAFLIDSSYAAFPVMWTPLLFTYVLVCAHDPVARKDPSKYVEGSSQTALSDPARELMTQRTTL